MVKFCSLPVRVVRRLRNNKNPVYTANTTFAIVFIPTRSNQFFENKRKSGEEILSTKSHRQMIPWLHGTSSKFSCFSFLSLSFSVPLQIKRIRCLFFVLLYSKMKQKRKEKKTYIHQRMISSPHFKFFLG